MRKAWLWLVFMVLTGCADSLVMFYRSASTASGTAVAGYQALSAVNRQKTDAIAALARSGQVAEADKQLADWTKTYDTTRKAFDALSAVVVAAGRAAPSIEAAADKGAAAAPWIAAIAKAVAEASSEMARAGIIPGGVP